MVVESKRDGEGDGLAGSGNGFLYSPDKQRSPCANDHMLAKDIKEGYKISSHVR